MEGCRNGGRVCTEPWILDWLVGFLMGFQKWLLQIDKITFYWMWSCTKLLNCTGKQKILHFNREYKIGFEKKVRILESRKRGSAAISGRHGNIDHFLHHRVRESNLLWFHGKPGSCVFIWLRGRHFSIIQVFQVIKTEKPSGWEGKFLRDPEELSLYWTVCENICCLTAAQCNYNNTFMIDASN